MTFVNFDVNECVTGVAAVSVADHLLCNFAIFPNKAVKHNHCFVTTRNFKNINIHKLNEDLEKTKWSTIEAHDNVNDMWISWKKLYDNVVNKHCPIKKFRAKKQQIKWYSQEIQDMKFSRDLLHQRALLTDTERAWCNYRKSRNKFTGMVREAKRQYYSNGINENIGNSKITWKLLEDLIGNCTSASIPCLEINGVLVKDFKEIADGFNNFFITIGENLASKIPNVRKGPLYYTRKLHKKRSLKFEFKEVTPEEIHKILSGLNETKATGLDNYQSKLLKLTSPSICKSLTFIINKSLSTGQFPDEWKSARIAAIYKKGNKLSTGNYRPVSILPVLSKVSEKIVHKQLYDFLRKTTF